MECYAEDAPMEDKLRCLCRLANLVREHSIRHGTWLNFDSLHNKANSGKLLICCLESIVIPLQFSRTISIGFSFLG